MDQPKPPLFELLLRILPIPRRYTLTTVVLSEVVLSIAYVLFALPLSQGHVTSGLIYLMVGLFGLFFINVVNLIIVITVMQDTVIGQGRETRRSVDAFVSALTRRDDGSEGK